MKLTIVVDDNAVGVNGEFREVVLPNMGNIHAIQWDGTKGHVEYKDQPNESIQSITEFQSIIDLWTALTPPPELEPTPEELTQQAIETVMAGLQADIDSKAKALGFSGGNALMLYAGFTNIFQELAQTFASWEASVWVEAESYKQDVLNGIKPMISAEEAVAMMPPYTL
tara:strand:+ start:801 stop:1307 length:507 start_codon:yes stop_codon:yes gene_type:complete